MSKTAEAVKREMMTAVTLRRELEALEQEWRDLLEALENSVIDDEGLALAESVNRERMALRRAFTRQQLKNWARVRAGRLTPLQNRILGQRYVQGCTWGDIVARQKKAKQYLLREHNKALEKLAEQVFQNAKKSLEK